MATYEEIEGAVFGAFAEFYADGGFDELIAILVANPEWYREYWDSNADGLSTSPITIDPSNRAAALEAFKKLHYARNLLQPDWNETQLAQNLAQFYLETEERSLFHGTGNLKFVGRNGHFEYIVKPTSDGFDILDDPNSISEAAVLGTYNFAMAGNDSEHNRLDVLPWYIWGNSPADPSTYFSRTNLSLGWAAFVSQPIEFVENEWFAEIFGWLQNSNYEIDFNTYLLASREIGTTGDDNLDFNIGVQIIDGLAGNDFLAGGANADLLIGGTGSDTVDYSFSPEAVIVSLQAGKGYHGDASDWHLPDEYDSIENVRGSHFADLIAGDDSSNTLEGLFGDDTLAGLNGNDVLQGGPGNDTLDGGSGIDFLFGGDDNDTLNNLNGGTMEGGSGDDTISLSRITFGYSVIDGGADFDVAYIVGDGFYERDGVHSTIDGQLRVDSHNSSITDYLIGLADGSESYTLRNRVHNSNSSVQVLFSDVEQINVDGDEGDDLIVYYNGTDYFGGIGIDLFAANWRDQTSPIEWRLDTSPDTTLANGVTVGSFERVHLLLGSGDDYVNGGSSADYLDGGGGQDLLVGDNGSDILLGGADDDVLLGGSGVDILYGGDNNDTLNNLNGGTMEGGSGDDTISLSRITFGYSVIDGGADFDVAYIVGDGFYERDGVHSSIDGQLHATSHQSAINDYLLGLADGSESYTLRNRVHNSNSSVQVLFSDVEQINVDGDEGDDLIVYFNGTEYFGGSGIDRFAANWRDQSTAIEWDMSTGSVVTLANGVTIDGFERVHLLLGSGDDIVRGGISADYLDGGLGDDTLAGDGGNDIYVIDSLGDVVTELAGDGTDKIITSVKINAALAGFANIEIFELAGTEGTLLGNDFDTTLIANPEVGSKIFAFGGIDTLIGSAFNDRLDGGAGDDTLFGKDGRDRLDGGLGADDMFGGDGDDRYFVDNLGDSVTELDGEGTDQIRSSVDWTLGDFIENLRLRGSADSGIGNDLDNVIQAVASGSFLDGGAGNDNLRGSQGMDTILGGDDNDTINGRSGDDDLQGGSGDDFIKGRSGEDHLQGGSGNDNLIGGKDNDLIEGGADQDELKGEAGADTFKWSDGDFAGLTDATADRVTDFSQSDGDVIDVSAVDAIMGSGDDAFTFIADAAFSGTAGELRFEQEGTNTMIYMDVDGDAVADYAIRLDGTINLAEADFIL